MITETPTATLTPSATPTPTPNYYIELPTRAGEPARIAREASAADLVIIFLLFAILLSMWLFRLTDRLKGEK